MSIQLNSRKLGLTTLGALLIITSEVLDISKYSKLRLIFLILGWIMMIIAISPLNIILWLSTIAIIIGIIYMYFKSKWIVSLFILGWLGFIYVLGGGIPHTAKDYTRLALSFFGISLIFASMFFTLREQYIPGITIFTLAWMIIIFSNSLN